jgi:hypothetical protein
MTWRRPASQQIGGRRGVSCHARRRPCLRRARHDPTLPMSPLQLRSGDPCSRIGDRDARGPTRTPEAPHEDRGGIPEAPRSRRTATAESGLPTVALVTGRSRRRSRRRDLGWCTTTSRPDRISHLHRTTLHTADHPADIQEDRRSTSFGRIEPSCRRTATGTRRGPRRPTHAQLRRGVPHGGYHDPLTALGVHVSEADRVRRTRSIS